MYRDHFGLKADPFRVNPDPSFLYLSDGHREALSMLTYAIRERKGFAVLTGEVGTGKTTVLNAMLSELSGNVETAYVFNTRLTVEDLFAYILDELSLPRPEPFRKSAALHVLNAHLIERLEKGLQTLLILDEAQNLSVDLLEEVRMLSNLETPQSKLLQILLVGQPELSDTLGRIDMRQLRQRVELMCRIQPLTILETAEYVPARLRVAGHGSGAIFTDSSLHSVYRYTRGIPRVINVLCDNALLAAYAADSPCVSDNTVHEVARDLGLTRTMHYRFQDPPKPVPAEITPLPVRRARTERERRGWRRLLPGTLMRRAHGDD